MKLLAFETTDKTASVALLSEEGLFVRYAPDNLRHAESVLPTAEALLQEFGMSTADMDAFAVDAGPGSFTGVRIGVCMANGLAAWHEKPVVAVNALETLARPYLAEERPILALIEARNGNGYAAIYAGERTLLEPCACVKEEVLAQLPAGGICLGSGSPNPENVILPDAGDVAMLVAQRLALSGFPASGYHGEKEVTPLYLRPSQAERLWEERE